MSKGIQAQGISVARGGRTILRNVDIKVEPARLLVIAGPNGGGKSTLLRALCRVWPVSEGSVFIDGVNLNQLPRRELAVRIGYVPQDTSLDFGFSVREVVSMGRHPHRSRFAIESNRDRDAISEAMDTCDVAHLAGRIVTGLSGGERQRVSIARSLAVQPDFLLLDEPTASLDIEHSLNIFRLCRKLAAGGRGVVVSTHDLNAALRFADHVALIHRGELTSQGTAAAVLNPESIHSVFGVDAEPVQTGSGVQCLVFHSTGELL